MKYLFALLTCITLRVNAQSQLNFNKGFMESINKWVAIKTPVDTIYGYGFIYMDPDAGITVHQGGLFKIKKDGVFISHKNPPNQIRIERLHDDGRVKVAWIPDDKIKEMQEDIEPSWLSLYRVDTTSVRYLFRMGFSYNGGNQIDKALYYLNRVKKANPDYPGLAFEFIYAHNATNQFAKAEAIINDELKKTPNNGNLYKELVYAQVKSGKMDKAEETYKKGILLCSADIKSEMVMNIIYTYFTQKNKEKFSYWADNAQAWMAANDPRIKAIEGMRQTINK